MNITLPSDMEQFVQDKVNSGQYHFASEVVGEALRLLADREEWTETRKQELRIEIAAGIRSLQHGGGVDGEEFFIQLEREQGELERKRTPA